MSAFNDLGTSLDEVTRLENELRWAREKVQRIMNVLSESPELQSLQRANDLGFRADNVGWQSSSYC